MPTTLGSTTLEFSARRTDLSLPYNTQHLQQTDIHDPGGNRAPSRRSLRQCFPTFVRPRPGKFFFHKTRPRSQQIYS